MKMPGNRCMLIVLLLSALLFASVNDRQWRKPLENIGGGLLYDMCSTGDFLWLLTDNGVGRYNTITGETRFFSLSVLGFEGSHNSDWSEWNMAAGDSEHIAIFEREDPAYMQYFNGSRWQHVDFGYRCTEPSIGLDGSVWVAKDRRADDLADTVLCFTTDGKRKIVADILPDTFSVRDVEVDGDGIVWLAGYIGREDTDGTSIYAVYRLDGTQIELVAREENSSLDMWTDMWKQIHFNNNRALYNYENGELVPYVEGVSVQPFSLGAYLAPVIDSDGNIWTWTKGTDGPLLRRITMNDTVSEWMNTAENHFNPPMAACGNGVYLSGNDGLWVFGNNDTIAEFISQKTLWGTCAWDGIYTISFGINGPLYLSKINYVWPNNFSLNDGNGVCRELPGGNVNIYQVVERADGTLVMGGETSDEQGLFVLEDTSWRIVDGTRNLGLHNPLFEDSDRKLWCGLDSKLLHQTDDGWELVDSTNSNLPWIGEANYINYTAFVQDKNGYIWGLFNRRFAAKTLNGHDWEVFTSADLNYPEGVIEKIALHESGAVQLLILKECGTDTCTGQLDRLVVSGNGWDIETVTLPQETASLSRHNPSIHLSGNGDIWLEGNGSATDRNSSENDPYFYRHKTGDSEWMRYDNADVPYQIMTIIGEDADGLIYFRDKYDDVVIFNQNEAGSVTHARIIRTHLALSVRNISHDGIAVRYPVSETGMYSLRLITTNGRLVAKLDEGFLQAGVYRKTFRLRSAPGVYFVQLETPDARETVPLVLR